MKKHLLSFAVVALLGLLPTIVRGGLLTGEAFLDVQGWQGATIYNDTDQDSTTTGSVAGASLDPNLSYVTPSASGRARYGQLTAHSHGDSNNPGDTNGFRATMQAVGASTFQEQVVITSPTIPAGTPATMTSTMRLTGSLSYDDQGLAPDTRYVSRGSISLSMSVAGQLREATYLAGYDWGGNGGQWFVDETIDGVQQRIGYQSPPSRLGGTNISKILEIDNTFVFGQPFDISASLRTFASSQAFSSTQGSGLDFISNALNTATWNGLKDVRLQDGTPVTDYMALGTTSMRDYSLPIPEPKSITMFSLGVLLLLRRNTKKLISL